MEESIERVAHASRADAAQTSRDALNSATVETVREWRRRQSEERAQRRARTLAGLERSLFGYRMPPAAGVLMAAEWHRDELDDYCTRCGATRARFEDLTGGCGECRNRRLPFSATIRLGRYAPPLSQWIPAIKNRAWRDMGEVLGRQLGQAVNDAINAGRLPAPDLVTAVPVHWLRKLLRGIDHSEVIGREVARQVNAPFLSTLRASLAHRQAGEDRSGRSRGGRFRPRRAHDTLAGRHVLLLDDVRTTGATLADACLAVRCASPRSVSLAVCAATDPPRRNALNARPTAH